MPIQLNVTEETTKYLNSPATDQFQLALEQYANDLLSEASRLEATGKSTKGNPEITSTMIKDADLLLRRGYTHHSKKPLLIFAQIAATVGSFVTGLLSDISKLKEPLLLVIFIAVLTVTITATVFVLMKD